jgi:hypothetical protein
MDSSSSNAQTFGTFLSSPLALRSPPSFSSSSSSSSPATPSPPRALSSGSTPQTTLFSPIVGFCKLRIDSASPTPSPRSPRRRGRSLLVTGLSKPRSIPARGFFPYPSPRARGIPDPPPPSAVGFPTGSPSPKSSSHAFGVLVPLNSNGAGNTSSSLVVTPSADTSSDVAGDNSDINIVKSNSEGNDAIDAQEQQLDSSRWINYPAGPDPDYDSGAETEDDASVNYQYNCHAAESGAPPGLGYQCARAGLRHTSKSHICTVLKCHPNKEVRLYEGREAFRVMWDRWLQKLEARVLRGLAYWAVKYAPEEKRAGANIDFSIGAWRTQLLCWARSLELGGPGMPTSNVKLLVDMVHGLCMWAERECVLFRVMEAQDVGQPSQYGGWLDLGCFYRSLYAGDPRYGQVRWSEDVREWSTAWRKVIELATGKCSSPLVIITRAAWWEYASGDVRQRWIKRCRRTEQSQQQYWIRDTLENTNEFGLPTQSNEIGDPRSYGVPQKQAKLP